MGGNVETIKERLDITDVVSGYIKVEKAGASFKACCPFHNEKTPSFYISPARQSFYCFGCGSKGDIFTFIEEIEGVDFKGALKLLADKAGVELEYHNNEAKGDRDKLYSVLISATEFFENNLREKPEALTYLSSRGVDENSIKKWRIGYAKAEWRSLWSHLLALGFEAEDIIKAGLGKRVEGDTKKEPYDVFRDRIIFPLSDSSGQIIAFSGRALDKDSVPKYLNSPDTPLFTKSEVLYGLDKAKAEIRKKDYAVLVEGQMDIVLSHQAGVGNTVATSGTAFTQTHLERLKRLSQRIILAFDGDNAGEKAAEKSAILGLSLGMEVKIAALEEGSDPADLASGHPEVWRDVLRNSQSAPEFFLTRVLQSEKDQRKVGKLILKRVLPLVTLVESSIERSQLISSISQRSGIKEEALWDDLRRIKIPVASTTGPIGQVSKEDQFGESSSVSEKITVDQVVSTHRQRVEERLAEIRTWQGELPEGASEIKGLLDEEAELKANIAHGDLRAELSELIKELAQAEGVKDEESVGRLTQKVTILHKKIRALEEEGKKM